MPAPVHYVYTHTSTEATTGYFSCEPEPALPLEAMLDRLEDAPMDAFLHRAALRDIMHLPQAKLNALAAQANGRPVLAALLAECAHLRADALPDAHAQEDAALPDAASALTLAEHSPLPLLRARALPDAALHRTWSRLFADNILRHRALPHPEEGEPTPLYSAEQLPDAVAAPPIGEVRAQMLATPAPAWERPPAQETAARALSILVDNGIVGGVEMRHEASLAPVALLRPWNLDISVQCGALNHTLRGTATTYGRGLSVAAARASYAMEMIERASAYASVQDNAVLHTARPMPLVRARLSELRAHGLHACDPNTLPLDAPYADQPLCWLEAVEAGTGDTVLVPAQCVYLFCNLDEPALCDAPGSTGLASGNTLDEAKVAALLECIERDAEATIPYDRRRCFVVRSEDARIQALLDDYAARGVHVQCMDLTSAFGVPCYQCFVTGPDGDVRRATGAHLHGTRALMSALTEVPWPWPNSPASAPPLPGLPVRMLESLPDYRMESPARDVALLEAVLGTHGHTPLYVELTRADLELPVVRAIIPGLEQNPEPDNNTRIRPRLFTNYLRAFAL